jgi:hypothetical protein
MLRPASKHRIEAKAEKRGDHGEENDFKHCNNPICEPDAHTL